MIERPRDGEQERPQRCLWYRDFVDRLETGELDRWFASVRRDLRQVAETREYRRLIAVQRALIGLIDVLDPARTRFPNVNERGRLPEPPAAAVARRDREPDQVARFVAAAAEYGQHESTFPWQIVDDWSRRHRLRCGDADARRERTCTRRLLPLRTALVVRVSYESPSLVISASLQPWWRPRASRAASRWVAGPVRRRARRVVNDLLARFDRPLII
jgi:hypothetical protein